MLMRKMRDSAKWMMLLLTLAFVAWLVLDWVQAGEGAQGAQQNPVVGVVNGQEIRYVEWNETLQSQLEQARRQVEGSLSDQERHRIETQAWDQLVTRTLIQQELDRLGVEASDEEVRQAFRTSPPPSLRDHPAFQTDGEFDMQKYRQFFAQGTANEQLLAQIESYYRQQIPRTKLFQMVAEEVSLSEEDLWRHYRDQNSTARVRYVSLPADSAVPDDAVEVTDEEIEAYYRENRDEFSRPPVAVVDLVSLDAEPSASDSAQARTRIDSVRALIDEEGRSFDDVVEEISEESPSGLEAADLGSVSRDDMVGPLGDAAFSAPRGEVVGPVESPSGYHLVRVSSRQGDQVTLSHVLAPVQLSVEAEDELFDRMDRLEEIALRSDLETAADSLDLELRDDVRLEEGSDFVPGAGSLGVGVAWAFESETSVDDLSRFFENASGRHLLELEDRVEAGVRPLEEVRSEIRERLVRRKKEERLRQRLDEAMEALRGDGGGLRDLASERGWEVGESEAFTRIGSVPGLGQATPAVGAAFGLEPGQTAGPFEAGGDRMALIELLEKEPADREDFEARKERLRASLQEETRQQHLQRWLQALREEAEIEDRRDQLDQRGQEQRPPPTGGIGGMG
ncbi:MAG: SurA N-terminal domain-containing protein [Gemmatimonadota bacterium]